MCREPTRPIISPRTLRSISFLNSNIRPKTENSAKPKSAAAQEPRSTNTYLPMSELTDAIDRYLDSLRQANASPHTLRNYSAALAQFADYFSPPAHAPPSPPSPPDMCSLQTREWRVSFYQRGLDPISARIKLAFVRSLFKFFRRE